ncbi:MAG: SufD family Fe-S cluster assembly protein [Deltaproteobacteria bacterium]|nr:SufD family Fe-S cluster assembly protein [Candidatus Anaeroferrophillacea bacterium]
MYTVDFLPEELRLRAAAAVDKPASCGADIDVSGYVHDPEHDPVMPYEQLAAEQAEVLAGAGFEVRSEDDRAASFLQVNHHISHCNPGREGVEVMSTRAALERFAGLPEYWWRAVSVDADKYTARAALGFDNGYFIRALPGVSSRVPVQACMFMSSEKVLQNVHNIIIVEEGADLQIISGCATSKHLKSGLHLGITEFYVKKNARLTFTMIHNWAEDVVTRPRSVAHVDEGGVFVSNYICMKKVRDLQMYPTAFLRGAGATARFNSIVAAPAGSHLDLGSRVELSHPGCRAEIISRTVSFGGDIIARGHLIGSDPGVKAHLECHGLMLSEKGLIHAVPELEGRVSGVEMSHEAAVGRIAPEEVEYLMARGLNEDEAVSTIVRGFLSVAIEGLPASLQRDLDDLMAAGKHGGM